jgi:hypothetical protein
LKSKLFIAQLLTDEIIYDSPIEGPISNLKELLMIEEVVYKAYSVKGLLKEQNS